MQLLKVATFVSNKVKPKRCNCGESVAFNVPGVASYIRDSGIDKIITDATIRNFVTSKQVGCVGKSTKFWGRTASATSAHISRHFLAADVLTEIDKGMIDIKIIKIHELNIQLKGQKCFHCKVVPRKRNS